MEHKIDRIAEDVAEIKVDIAEIKKDVSYHIKRTDALEDFVMNDMRPVQEHVEHVRFLLKAFKYVAGVSGLLAAIYHWLV